MFDWDPALTTGVEAIDGQHRELFARANAVLLAIEAGRGGAEARSTLAFLTRYAQEHFRDEEALQREAGYQEAERHAELHARIERRLQALAQAWEESPDEASMVADLKSFVNGWLAHHVLEEDVAMARHLARR
jgi:hemerythrin